LVIDFTRQLFCKCKYKFKEPIIALDNNGDFLISGEFSAHLSDTHGIPPELLPEMVRMVMDKPRINKRRYQ